MTDGIEQMGTVSEKGGVKLKCPAFNGDKDKYEDWSVKVKHWAWLTRKTVEAQGLVILMGLEGKAFDAVKDLEDEVLRGASGADAVMKKLDEVYKKELVWSNYDKVVSYLKIERMKSEKIRDYLLRYEKLANDCKRVGGTLLDGEPKGIHLLEQANLTEGQKHLVISGCGREKLEYDTVKHVMKRIFESSEEEKEDSWLERYDKKREPERRWQGNRGGKNPVRNGIITKCNICRSENHWALQCPRHFNNREKKVENVAKEETTEKVYLEDGQEYWGELEAILDTGCRQTVIGDI